MSKSEYRRMAAQTSDKDALERAMTEIDGLKEKLALAVKAMEKEADRQRGILRSEPDNWITQTLSALQSDTGKVAEALNPKCLCRDGHQLIGYYEGGLDDCPLCAALRGGEEGR